jgi:hypothetical protein
MRERFWPVSTNLTKIYFPPRHSSRSRLRLSNYPTMAADSPCPRNSANQIRGHVCYGAVRHTGDRHRGCERILPLLLLIETLFDKSLGCRLRISVTHFSSLLSEKRGSG